MSISEPHDYTLINQLAEEFAERYRRGERPAITEYTQKHPTIAEEIRELFAALVEIEQADHDRFDAAPPTAPEGLRQPIQLGDFRIIREVGRGGMGIVYEAEQLSLQRHVALKVLPQQALPDNRHKRRFDREARAAARMHHTNIVPVFGVGEQDGLHYYVMQFIQGLGLDQVLEELKAIKAGHGRTGELAVPVNPGTATPPEPTAAEMARSLLRGEFEGRVDGAGTDKTEFQNGHSGQPPVLRTKMPVVTGALMHDAEKSVPAPLQPGAAASKLTDNSALSGVFVLPGRSGSSAASGRIREPSYWQSVAQIGVQVGSALQYAHDQGILHRDIKPSNLLLDLRGTVWVTDFGLAKSTERDDITHTGDILGTLRYMPPEAFDGKADPRSDIYSLGITLYEMLALKPAFEEMDRRRLIKTVTCDDAARLERLIPEIPRDLATIVHKAIERDPAHRYATAGSLAEDLQRFFDDEPIQARRTSTTELLARWCRRNKSLTALLAIVPIVAVASTIAAFHFRSLGLEQRKLAHEKSRLVEEKQAALAASLKSGAELTVALNRVEAARKEADEQRQITHQNLYYAQMKVATRLWQSDRGRALFDELLDSWQPREGKTDLRGWEWFYLRSLPHREVMLLPARGGSIRTIRWSPDGKLLAVAAAGAPLRIWDAAQGRLVGNLDVSDVTFAGLAWSSDSRRLAVAGNDKRVHIWDLQADRQLLELPVQTSAVTAVAWGRDERIVAWGTAEGAVRLWDVAAQRESASWTDHHAQVTGLAFDGGTNQLAAGFADGLASTWNVSDGKPLHRFDHQDYVTSIDFNPDGSLLACGVRTNDGDRLRLWDARTGQMTAALAGHTHWVEALAFSADGRRLASVSRDQTLILWDLAALAPLITIRGHADELYAVCWSPDGQRVAAGGTEGTVSIWDTRSHQEYRNVEERVADVGFHLAPICWRPDGMRLASAGGRDATRVVVHTLDSSLPTMFAAAHEAPLSSLAWSPSGDLLASADRASRVIIWNPVNGTPSWTLEGHRNGVQALCFSGDGQVLASSSNDEAIILWNAASGQKLRSLDTRLHGGAHLGATSVAFRPGSSQPGTSGPGTSQHGSRQLASGGGDGLVKIWNADTGDLLQTLPQTAAGVLWIAWRPDGKQLAACGTDRMIRVWDLENTVTVAVARGHTDWVRRVVWNPAGTRLASCNAAGASDVKIWDARTGQEILQLPMTDKTVRDIAWSPDGMQLAVSNSDGTVGLLDAAIGYGVEHSPVLLPILEQRLAADPFDPNVVRMQMEIYQRAGQEAEARQARQRLIAICESQIAKQSDRADLADLLAGLLLDDAAGWIVLRPTEMVSAAGATLSWRPDQAIAVGGTNPDNDVYTIVGDAGPDPITAICLESLPDTNCPRHGPGRSPSGNFNMSSLRIATVGEDTGAEATVRLEQGLCDFSEEAWGGMAGVIDDSDATGWSIFPQIGRRHWAVLPTQAEDVKVTGQIRVRMEFLNSYKQHTLGCFRLCVTNRGDPLRVEKLRFAIGAGELHGFGALGCAYAVIGKTDQAALSFSRMLDQNSESRTLVSVLERAVQFGEAFAALKELRPDDPRLTVASGREKDPVESRLTVAIVGDPSSAAAYEARGRWYGQRGRWAEATADLEESLRLNPENPRLAYHLTPLTARLQDPDRYRRRCQSILDRWGGTHDITRADAAVKGCLLRPDVEFDRMQISRLVDIAFSANESDPWHHFFLMVKGLHEYRRGRFNEAITFCRRSRQRNSEVVTAASHAIEALAHHQSGELDEARKSLHAAEALVGAKSPRVTSGDFRQDWADWLFAETLYREAVGLIP